MSTISDALQAMHNSDQTVQAIFAGKAAMQRAFIAVVQANMQIQSLVDSASFEGVDPALMAALGNAWTALQTCATAMGTPEIQEAINWVAAEG